MKKIILIIAMTIALTSCQSPYQTKAQLKTQVAELQAQVAEFEAMEVIRIENDNSVFIIDTPGLVESGVIKLVDAELVPNSSDTYKFNGVPGLFVVSENDKWIKLDAQKGETIQIYTYGVLNGPKYIGYNICYTNSSRCGGRFVETNILAK